MPFTPAPKRTHARTALLGLSLLYAALTSLSACHPKPKDGAPMDVNTPSACSDCAKDQVCIEGECESSGSPVLSMPVGGGDNAVAIVEQTEAPTLGPTSFAVRGNRYALLDAENHQLKLFQNSQVEGRVALDRPYEDVVYFDDDRFALLERSGEGSVALLRRDGSVQTRVSLLSLGIGDLKDVGHLARRDSGVWVEYRRWMVRLLLADGTEDVERRTSQAYLMADNKHQLATRLSERTLSFEKLTTSSEFVTKDHEFPNPLFPWWSLDSDAQGKIYALLGIWQEDDYVPYVYVYNSDLSLDRSVPFLGISPGDSATRTFAVSPDGGIYHLVVENNNVQVIKH